MFGTLRVGPKSKQIDFVERANGKSFTEMGGVVPPHSACTQCRAKKLGCGGQKPKCSRCNAASLNCVYAPTQGSAGRRRAKRNCSGDIIQPKDAPGFSSLQPRPGSEHTQATTGQYNAIPKEHTIPSSRTPTSGSELSPSMSISTPTSSAIPACVPSTSSPPCGSLPQGKESDDEIRNTGTQFVTQDVSSLGPDLSVGMLEPPFGSNPTDASFSFLVPESMTDDVGGSISQEYGGQNMFADFGVDFDTLWSKTGVLAFPSNDGTTMSSTVGSYAGQSSMPIAVSTLSPTPLLPGRDTETEPKCARQCTVIPLLDEADDGIYNTRPERLEGALSWLKKACKQSQEVLQCQTCYSNSEQMMLLLMLCDKLIMFSRKLLWHTLDESNFQSTVTMRDYEISEPREMATVTRLLCGHQIAGISKLLAGIKISPALEGKQVHSTMIRNMEQQVSKTLESVKECITTSI
ncbi:hypothetical protein F5Y12DRAFT_741516 [Xylaria sp. FL1777]|nr:hypothetical protein F5Y12DRAFT_741516 [Xylaria sp. FL1777]